MENDNNGITFSGQQYRTAKQAEISISPESSQKSIVLLVLPLVSNLILSCLVSHHGFDTTGSTIYVPRLNGESRK
jgi:hypothetical protein